MEKDDEKKKIKNLFMGKNKKINHNHRYFYIIRIIIFFYHHLPYLNNLTFDMLIFQPINFFNILRNIPIECISFNDCVELGSNDNYQVIIPSTKNRKSLL